MLEFCQVSPLTQQSQIPIPTVYGEFTVLRKTAAFQVILLNPEDKHCLKELFHFKTDLQFKPDAKTLREYLNKSKDTSSTYLQR